MGTEYGARSSVANVKVVLHQVRMKSEAIPVSQAVSELKIMIGIFQATDWMISAGPS